MEERAHQGTTPKLCLLLMLASSLLLLLSARGAAAQQEAAPAPGAPAPANATKDVLTKEECKEAVPYEDFATDERIISCVRGASESCCEAMSELLGEASPVHYCTCSSGVLEEVLDEAVPMFAKDIIHTRIEDCKLPVAGDERCVGVYDDSNVGKDGQVPEGLCVDEYPPDVDTQYTCVDQATFGKCDESWMQGYCLAACGKCEAAAAAGEEEAEEAAPEEEGSEEDASETESEDEAAAVMAAQDGEVLANGTAVLSNCTDEKSPSDNSRHDCAKQAEFGKCDEGWMQGYCQLSCKKCILPTTRTIANAASATTSANVDAPSPDTDTDDATNTDTDVTDAAAPSRTEVTNGMNVTTVGYWDEAPEGAMEVASGGATGGNGSSSCVDEYPPNVDTQYSCEDQAGYGKCEESWMQGYCLASCDKCMDDDSNLSQ